MDTVTISLVPETGSKLPRNHPAVESSLHIAVRHAAFKP